MFTYKKVADYKVIANTGYIAILAIFAAFTLFKPFILTRVTIADQSTLQRTEYNKAGTVQIKNSPIFGLGAGESVLHMEQAFDKQLEPWQKQPPHNYFLIAGAELGIPGMLILIWIFISHLKAISYKLKANFTTYYILLATILISILVLMMFDHYFYTLQQTQIILWIILGIISAETFSVQSTQNTENKKPSG